MGLITKKIMNSYMLYSMAVLMIVISLIQNINAQSAYEASDKHPFGMLNPEAPEELNDFAPLIGICDCESIRRNKDKTWMEAEHMIWKFKYIMNGTAIQDESIKESGNSGSIRQYNVDSTKWYVHYYSSFAPAVLPSWAGKKINDDIILYRDQTAPNGMAGFYKITFHNISEDGFKWIGEWVNQDESIVYPTWKIDCKKRK